MPLRKDICTRYKWLATESPKVQTQLFIGQIFQLEENNITCKMRLYLVKPTLLRQGISISAVYAYITSHITIVPMATSSNFQFSLNLRNQYQWTLQNNNLSQIDIQYEARNRFRPKIKQILWFYAPKLGLRWNYLIDSRESTENFTIKS